MEKFSLPIEVVSGNIAGWVAISASQPFDLIKTKYQLNEHVCFNALKKMVMRDGPAILYRGASSIYLFAGIIFSIEITTFEAVNNLMVKYQWLQSPQNHIGQLMLTGGIVGLISSFIYTPTQYTKIHSQIDKDIKPQGSVSRIVQTIKHENLSGIRKLYTGHKWTLLRDVPGLSLFYGGYHSILYKIAPKREEATFAQQLLASSTVALLFAGFTYPLDTIKTNLQSKKACFSEMVKDKFWKERSFVRGYKASLVRGFTMDTTALTVYENCRNYFYGRKNF